MFRHVPKSLVIAVAVVAAINVAIWAIPSTHTPPVGMTYQLAPGFNPEYADMQLYSITKAQKYWSGTYTLDRPVPIYFGTDLNASWFIQRTAADGYGWVGQQVYQGIKTSSKFSSNAGTHTYGDKTALTFTLGSQRGFVTKDEVAMGAHEYTHIVQNDILGGDITRLPCWALEGGATYFSFEIMNRSIGNTVKVEKIDRAESMRLMEKSNSDTCVNELLGYTLGYLAVKQLADQYGKAKLLSWWKASKTSPWRDSFQAVYGFPVSSFYERV